MTIKSLPKMVKEIYIIVIIMNSLGIKTKPTVYLKELTILQLLVIIIVIIKTILIIIM